MPEGYRTGFVALGAWAVASDPPPGDAAEEVVEAYRSTGRFPDGAVLAKEVATARAGDMTTGRVSRAGEVLGWFVMVKDAEGRHPGDPLRGDGWGWARFDAGAPEEAVTADHREECLGCHVPAEGTDRVYVEGYPPLRDRPTGGGLTRAPGPPARPRGHGSRTTTVEGPGADRGPRRERPP